MMLGMLQSLKKAYNTLKPYFIDTGSYQKNRLYFLGFIVSNLISALTIAFLYTYVSGFLGLLALPVVSYQLLTASLMDFVGVLAVYGTAQAANYFCSQKLVQSLTDSFHDDLSRKWFSDAAYYGLHHSGDEKALQINHILRHDTHVLVHQSITLLQNLFNLTSSFIVGAYQLWVKSAHFAFQIFNREILMPGLMSIGAMTYALSYNFLAWRLNRDAQKYLLEEKHKDGEMEAVIHHIDANREAIALQRSVRSEKMNYDQAYRSLFEVKAKKLKMETRLTFVDHVHQYLTIGVGLLLSAPSLMAQAIKATDLLEILSYFKSIVNFFSASQTHRKPLNDLDTSIERIQAFQKALKRWQTVEAQKEVHVEGGDTLSLQGLSIYTPDGEKTLLQDASHTFSRGKITLISGASGTGKSTLFRVLGGIWPYAKGTCSLSVPQNQMHIVPQEPCLPYRSTLAQALTAPLEDPESTEEADLKKLLTDFELEDKLRQLHLEDSWNKRLSGGEKKRVALISAVLKQPKLLLLDESFSALDKALRQKVERLLKHYLPDTTILLIDHTPDQASESDRPFYEDIVSIQNTLLRPDPQKASFSQLKV